MSRTLDIALIQACTPSDQAAALEHIKPLILNAAATGAQFIVTPECSNLMEARKDEKARKVTTEGEDVFIAGVRGLAHDLHVTILLGSAIIKSDGDPRSSNDSGSAIKMALNRSLLIGDTGAIVAHYDKIHLFDASTPDGKTYQESATVAPGQNAVVAKLPFAAIGLSVCYDLRFAHLYRVLAKGGANLICVPAAFTVPTGKAHWEVLLRARAIETGAFVVAAAQGGAHEDGRVTYGHSMVVNPWGEVVARLDHDHPAVLTATLDFAEVERARQALPQLTHDREFSL